MRETDPQDPLKCSVCPKGGVWDSSVWSVMVKNAG